jgi:hypothetical protein
VSPSCLAEQRAARRRCWLRKHEATRSRSGFRVGETKTYNASQLPAHSTLVCRVNRREDGRIVPYSNTIDVPTWSTWDPHTNYGWTQANVTNDIWFGSEPQQNGKRLRSPAPTARTDWPSHRNVRKASLRNTGACERVHRLTA